MVRQSPNLRSPMSNLRAAPTPHGLMKCCNLTLPSNLVGRQGYLDVGAAVEQGDAGPPACAVCRHQCSTHRGDLKRSKRMQLCVQN